MQAAFKKDQTHIDGILARNMDQANAFGFAARLPSSSAPSFSMASWTRRR
jgi:hypothetical protein